MSRLSDQRIWLVVVVANAALVAGLVAGWRVPALTMLVYFETFVAILWYTMETRRMQEAVSQQAALIASSLRGTLYHSELNAMMQINQLFVGSPQLRPYFYESVPFIRDPVNTENTKLYHELSSVADCLLDIFESVTHNMGQFPEQDQAHMDAWRNYLVSVFETSPFLNYHLHKHPDWYVSSLLQYQAQRPSGSA